MQIEQYIAVQGDLYKQLQDRTRAVQNENKRLDTEEREMAQAADEAEKTVNKQLHAWRIPAALKHELKSQLAKVKDAFSADDAAVSSCLDTRGLLSNEDAKARAQAAVVLDHKQRAAQTARALYREQNPPFVPDEAAAESAAAKRLRLQDVVGLHQKQHDLHQQLLERAERARNVYDKVEKPEPELKE